LPYKDPEKAREQKRRWRKANPPDRDKANAATRKYRAANPDKVRAQTLRNVHKHRAAHPEAAPKAARKWRKKYPDKVAAQGARKRAAKLRATPPWQSLAELDAIWIGRPEGHEVDHIHPLKGKLSCGLNVPWNLHYLPAAENNSKKTRMPQPGYFDWFSDPLCVHAEPTCRVWSPTNPEDE
jgi:hypothetical protein